MLSQIWNDDPKRQNISTHQIEIESIRFYWLCSKAKIYQRICGESDSEERGKVFGKWHHVIDTLPKYWNLLNIFIRSMWRLYCNVPNFREIFTQYRTDLHAVYIFWFILSVNNILRYVCELNLNVFIFFHVIFSSTPLQLFRSVVIPIWSIVHCDWSINNSIVLNSPKKSYGVLFGAKKRREKDTKETEKYPRVKRINRFEFIIGADLRGE